MRKINRKRVLILCLFLALFIVVGYKTYNNFKLVLNLEGAEEITLDVNDNYEEPGYVANFNDTTITNNVVVENEPDTHKIGTYKVQYWVKKRNRKIKKQRTINVVDKEPPVITLKGNAVEKIYIGESYSEEGYQAIDNYDGDITDRVVVTGEVDSTKSGTYEINYVVQDSSNNIINTKRSINVVTKTNTNSLPVLMYHFFYDASKGETGTDNNFMEISKFEEEIKYLVDNNYYFPSWEEVNDYMDKKAFLPNHSIVLTFDDGSQTFFNEAYPVLKKYGVKGTSFIITSWITPDSKYDSNILDYESHSHNMHRGGCTGGHGGIFQCIDDNKALDDLLTSKKIANNATVFCYPFGDVTDKEISLVKQAGYNLAFTTKGGKISPGMDKYRLPRVRISGGMSLTSFISAIK